MSERCSVCATFTPTQPERGYCCQRCELEGRLTQAVEAELKDMGEPVSKIELIYAIYQIISSLELAGYMYFKDDKS